MANKNQKQLLIVEDSPDLQLLLTHLLRGEGYKLHKAYNGKEALEILRSLPELPSLILLDLMMPVMDGLAFREEQRKDQKLKDIPVIVMTADANPELKAEALNVLGILRKPIDLEQLLQALDEVIN